NYDAASVEASAAELGKAGLPQRIMIDFSHANSSKQHDKQIEVSADVGRQMAAGDERIFGVMIESHLNPDAAWSDAKQQVTPANLGKIVDSLVVRSVSSDNKTFKDTLGILRDQIDQLDDEIMQKLANRMKISEKIGQYKKENNVTILQVGRWEEIVQTRAALGKAMGLDEGFTRDLLRLIHHESIQVQTKVMNKVAERV
ncbi:MAG TPA: hypothetical protein DDZ56_04500, partial [Cytophagales bacterium]|nr:hypothetical protein [Cytophagales bacterium]